ncbi:MurR/RpiR family transcriptional regulator [Frigidibacter sp. RF13]|uniref:MurR/RpiR family transcriptional regulator n=1 Tax=Frigidibacter sp. RF13 TaxID=2997340 RepID=UPI00227097A2|nr:MurR/RpiR family transcriptional regulator [Frigidibacter sp. RF13]MCY1127483.1 MurR/RpiR family transcriptional regulator [Frigidibacter sp. RF13]
MSDSAPHGPTAHETVRDRLLGAATGFSNAELKVIRVLLANYPAAGLTTVSRLAREAGVSDPTVIRLANRLGFEGYAEMQATLIAEVELHMRSPLTLPPQAPAEGANVYQDFLRETVGRCEEVARSTATADFERIVALLSDPKLRVLCLGGRFSRFVAGILQRCLHHLRPGTEHLDGSGADISDRLADIDRRHLLVLFDYRRYQNDTVGFARQARARGAQIALFTDVWRSPVADFADAVLTAPTETASPFDTLVTPLLQVEAVVAGVAERLAPDWRDRVRAMEAIRHENHITIETGQGSPDPGAGGAA